ncbi:actin-related protein 6, partial [Phenoliferia sp. Uapishka_3]
MQTLILDNGAHSIKAQWAHEDADKLPATFRNSISRAKADRRRNYVADELEKECMDYGGLVFKIPFEKGILTNWDAQKTIWDRVFGPKCLNLDPSSTRLLLTEPVFNLPNVQDQYDQMIFEEYEFGACAKCPAPSLVAFSPELGEPLPECVLVIDSGFSFTHIVPIMRGAILSAGVRRIDVGGKLLTNQLKELVSFRQWYMMDQTSVMEKAKEECCFVTENWAHDWKRASSASKDTSIVRTYVLPDFVPTSNNKLGYVRLPGDALPPPPPTPAVTTNDKGKGAAVPEEEQLLQMANERFAVPEAIFNPSSIGQSCFFYLAIAVLGQATDFRSSFLNFSLLPSGPRTTDLNQGGLSETIAHSIASLPAEVQGMFWANILCVGGNVGFEGFTGRFLPAVIHSSALGKLLIPQSTSSFASASSVAQMCAQSALTPSISCHLILSSFLQSSSPSNTPAPHSGASFPKMTYSDNARAFRLLLESLGVIHLHAVLGFSMGGGVAYHFGAIFGDYVDHIVCLATSAQTSLHNVAFLEGPKAALKASGEYEPGSKGPRAFGRCYCAWAYSHDWFEQKKWEDSGAKSLAEHFLNWEKNMGGWNGYDLRTLAWTWQNASIATATLVAGQKGLYSSLQDALKSMKPKALIMPTRTDQYFVPEDSEMEVQYLPNGKLAVVETIYGHVGGGGGGSKADNAFIDKEVAEFLSETS